MNFESLGLAPALLRALSEQGFVTPTPIQHQAIPLALNGEDLVGGAQTGTGKTAAFGLPLLHNLLQQEMIKGPRKTRALILVPTRELAAQVSEHLRDHAKYTSLCVAVIYGGASMGPQEAAFRRGMDVLVATPGRLIDHMERGTAHLDAVQTLVLDEADRMLDMGFLSAIKRILSKLPSQRQTLLFSATFEPRIKQLALEFMRNPQQIQVAASNAIVETITHRAHPVDSGRKRELLTDLLARRFQDQALVFAKTKHGCNRLTEHLAKAGLKALAIHGSKSQAQRQKALSDFRAQKIRILVATDVAARGLDIPNLPLVINHDLPTVAEDYIHRIGRTGRNHKGGEALSLVSPEEGGLLGQIYKLLRAEVTLEILPGFEPSRTINLNAPLPKQQQRSARSHSRGGAGRGLSRGHHAGRKSEGGSGVSKPKVRSSKPLLKVSKC